MSGLGCEKKKRQPYLLLDPHVLNGLLLLGDASSSLGHITLTPQYCPDKDTASGKSAEHLSSICTKSSNRKEEILVRTLERISPCQQHKTFDLHPGVERRHREKESRQIRRKV